MTFIHAVRGAGVRSLLVTGGVPSWGCTLIRWQAFGVVPRCGSYEEGCRSTPTHEQVFFFLANVSFHVSDKRLRVGGSFASQRARQRRTMPFQAEA